MFTAAQAAQKFNLPIASVSVLFTAAQAAQKIPKRLYVRSTGSSEIDMEAKDAPYGTGFSEDDLKLLWQSLEYMFEHDRSAARGEMSTRGLYVFKHDSELGNAHAHDLFKRISATKKVETPRDFGDYEVSVDDSNLPVNVRLERKVG